MLTEICCNLRIRSVVLGACLLAASAAACMSLDRPRPSVLLISIGGLRGDILDTDADSATPHLHALAESGTLFSHAITPVPWSRAAAASLLTGRSPLIHKLRSPLDRLVPHLPVLAEDFRAAGYRTGGIVAQFDLDHVFGLDRGFDVYDDRYDEPLRGDDRAPLDLPSLYLGDRNRDRSFRHGKLRQNSVRRNSNTTDAALGYLQRTSRPFFLWVSYFGAQRRGVDRRLRDRERWYVDTVGEVDAEIGRLMRGVTALGLHRDTIIVLHADHGSKRGGGDDLYDANVRVPLIVSWWGKLPYGRRIDSPVSLMDIAPTLRDLCGLPSSAAEGESLRALIAGAQTVRNDTAYLETYLRTTAASAHRADPHDRKSPIIGTLLRGIRDSSWKFIRAEPHVLIDVDAPARVTDAMRSAATSEELYDLRHDPAERVNLLQRETATAQRLRGELERLITQFPAEDAR